MTQEVSDFIPGSLEDTNKYIEVADRHHDTAKQKCQVRIQMCEDNVKSFIATLHNVLLAPDLCTVYFGAKDKNEVTLPHSAQRKQETPKL